jgi:5'-3' exoribonuclease 1
MEMYDLPTMDGLHLVQGLCDGVFLGAEALAGFPSLKTLPHAATLGYHGVNIHGSESRNKSMVIYVQNPHERKKPEAIASEMIGQRVFIGWPFLQEGKITAVSDSLFKHEVMSVVQGGPSRVVSNPHSPQGLGLWKMKAQRIDDYYSKRCGVITGDIDVLVHVRPLKGYFLDCLWFSLANGKSGMKRLENGAFVKDYEKVDKETEAAVQMILTNVVSEDQRFVERKAPPLSEEFPSGSKVFFLGEHAYGVAAQVSATTESTLSVVLAVSDSSPCPLVTAEVESLTVLPVGERGERKIQRFGGEPSGLSILSFL